MKTANGPNKEPSNFLIFPIAILAVGDINVDREGRVTRSQGALGRWRKPRLGAAVLAGCLMIGGPGLADVSTTDWGDVAPARLAAPIPAAPTTETAVISHASIPHGQSTGSATSDVLHAALGAALAALWLMGGAWVGIRSARISTPLNQSADQTRDARRIRFK